MSVYRPRDRSGKPKTPYWHFDFVIVDQNGERRRFHGSTGEKTKARAREAEKRHRARVVDGRPDLSLADAALRYCDEVAAAQPSVEDTERNLEHCCRLIGGGRMLSGITGDDIAEAVRRRAGETYGKTNRRLVSNATVNRQITETMRRLMRRARRVWGIGCDPDAIAWREVLLREPKERVREFTAEEAAAFWRELRPDYLPLIRFLAIRGFRVRSVLAMQKRDVDLAGRRVRVWIKGDGLQWRPVTAEQAALLATELARAPLPNVWTYKVQRGADRGRRRPVTYSGLRRTMLTTMAAAGIDDFRIHDLRHDFASKLLRATRDLALVKKALGHADIQSTMRYAHVLDDDVVAGMEVASRNSPGIAAAGDVEAEAKVN